MAKKLISLVLSLVMVIGLVPVMSVFAEDEASAVSVIYSEDFTNFDEITYNADYTATSTSYALKNNAGTQRMSIGTYFKADIVNMPGYDGELTNALKVTVNPNLGSSFDTTSGSGRLGFTGMTKSGLPGTKTDGALVYEFKMYIPENDSDDKRQDIAGFAMAPIVKSGEYYAVGTSAKDTTKRKMIATTNPGEWYDLKYVLLLNENKALVYCNGELTSYKEESVASKGYQFQIQSIRRIEDEHIIFDDFKVWHIAGKSAEDLSPQCITEASSRFADSQSVAITASPTVDFTEMVLNRQSVTTVSTDNVLVTKNDGTPVDVESVTVGNDKKSIVIKPVSVLEQGTNYNVKVTGLYDMYDQLIPDYEFSFKTLESVSVELEAAPKFTKANLFSGTQGAELTALENGYINVKYTLKNTSATKTANAVLLTVLRDGGDIKYFQFENGAIAPGAELSFDGSFMVDDAENQTIETYVWDSLSGAAALTDKYIISKDGITNVSVENQ